MVDHIRHWLHGHPALGSPLAVVLALGISVLSFLAGLALMLRLPPDYFVRAKPDGPAWQSHRVLWLAFVAAKNLVGYLLFLVGLVMALPLVPGPGLLFMLIGLGLIDFPGKRVLELRLLRQRHVLHSVNRIRARFGRPPLLTVER